MTAANHPQPIRILFMTTLLDRRGGAEKNLCEIVLHLDRKKFKPCVLAFKGGFLSRYLADRGIMVWETGVTRLFSLSTMAKAREFWCLLHRERIDLVVTYHHDADILGSLVGRLAGVPVISSRRDMGFQLERKHVLFYRWFNWLFSRFIAVSDAVKNEMVCRENITPAKIVTIHNGLDIAALPAPDQNRFRELKSELGLEEGKIVIGMVASFRPVKGQEFLVKAIAGMKKRWDEIQVVVVGYKDTEYFMEIESRVQNLGMKDLFIFPGMRDDVFDLLHLFDIFVISSRNEGFSNAIIEAMAAGLPVVASDSGGNREAVIHNRTGLLFPPRDSQALGAALNCLLGDNDLRHEFGRNGRQLVARQFTLARMLEENASLYEDVISRQVV